MRTTIHPLAPLVASFVTLHATPLDCVQATQVPRFKSGVDLVEVAVVVRDRDGRLLADLGKNDFQIIEEGAAQTILAFEHSAKTAGRAEATTEAPGTTPDVASNEQIAEARVFVLVLDGLHVAAQRTLAVQRYARQFIDQYIGTKDLAAIISPGAIGAASQDFTVDKVRLLSAVDQFSGNKLRSATVERDEEVRMAAGSRVILHAGKDPSDGERAYRVQALANVLETLAVHLNPVAGQRKTLLLFSEGIDYNLFDMRGEVQRYGSDVVRSKQRAVDAAMEANIAIYAIDPRMLSSGEGDRVETPIYDQPVRSNSLVHPGLEGEHEASIRSLRSLAEATGGFAAVNTNDLRGAFERIVDEASSYYLLRYTPSTKPKPGQFREVTVRVARPGARVVARMGYGVTLATRKVDVPKGVVPELAVLLSSPLPRGGLPLRVTGFPFKGPAKNTIVELMVDIPGRSLEFTERNGRFEGRLEISLVTVDSRARMSRATSATVDLSLEPEELKQVKVAGIRWLPQLDLAPGSYQVRVAGRTTHNGSSGLVTYDLDVPAFDAKQWAMSGVAMTSSSSAFGVTQGHARLSKTLGTPPALERLFQTGDQVRAAFAPYVPVSEHNNAEVFAEVIPLDGATSMPIHTDVAVERGQSWNEEIALTFQTAGLRPGRYALRVVLRRVGGTQTQVERKIPFTIVGRSD